VRHLFITNDFPPKQGGIESYLTSLLKGFAPEGVAVVAPAREGWEDVDAGLPYEVYRVHGSYLRATRDVHRTITRAIERIEADAMHFLAALPLGRLGPKIREESGIPFSVVAHGTGEILLPSRVPLARRALREVLSEADVVFANSNFTRGHVDDITKGEAHTVVLHPTVDVDRFSLAVGGGHIRDEIGAGGRFVVLFVSRLVKRKGADLLVNACAAFPDVLLVMVGDGPERRSLERLVHVLDIDDRVFFAGAVDDVELPEYYAAADAFCMPCTDRLRGLDTEGFGIVYLEAQAAGLPCIAGRCGGSAEAVEDGVTGVVLNEPSAKSVAVEIKRLLRDPALCATLGAAGRQRVERRFSPGVGAQQLEEALAAVLSD
jgi:phosphatidylinositol alpha-1,6-mannosyltransferase